MKRTAGYVLGFGLLLSFSLKAEEAKTTLNIGTINEFETLHPLLSLNSQFLLYMTNRAPTESR